MARLVFHVSKEFPACICMPNFESCKTTETNDTARVEADSENSFVAPVRRFLVP